MTKMRSIRAATALAVAIAAISLPAVAAQAAGLEVKIDNFTFTPQRLTVKAGTTVTWINEDDSPHTVASSTKAFKSKALDTDDKFSFTFTTPGAYEYFCSLHPHMTGTIVVEAATGSAAER
ncbi:MAG TPA: cupredoxin family copper-binding protein [Xanthobacteraceae bacterium]|jgi:plastocyanin